MADDAHRRQQAAQPRDLRLARGDLPARARPTPPRTSSRTTRAGTTRSTGPAARRPTPDSDRDNYFARAMMYGSVLSGGARRPRARHRRLRRHEHGRAAGLASVHLGGAALRVRRARCSTCGRFVLSEGDRYQQLELASADLVPRSAPGASDDGLDGWGVHDAHAPTGASRCSTSRAGRGAPARRRPRARRALPLDAGSTRARAAGWRRCRCAPTHRARCARRLSPVAARPPHGTGPPS